MLLRLSWLALVALGARHRDEITLGESGGGDRGPDDVVWSPYYRIEYETNRAGGIEGGMSNGMPIVVRGYMKPIPTLIKPLQTVDMNSGEAQPTRYEWSDVTSVPAASTVAESIGPDIQFHQAILDATHNDVIRYIGHTLHNALAISISLTSWHEEIHASSLPRHEAVYRAIAAKNPAKAEKAVRTLLADSRKDFDKKFSRQ